MKMVELYALYSDDCDKIDKEVWINPNYVVAVLGHGETTTRVVLPEGWFVVSGNPVINADKISRSMA